MVVRRITGVLLASVILIAPIANAAVRVEADRTTLPITDSVQVVFESDQELSTNPDFSLLEKDFDILGTSQSTRVNVVSGRVQRSSTWAIDLMASREGAVIIPSIEIGGERTQPLTLTIEPAAVDPDGRPVGEIMLDASVDTDNPYVQGQFVYTVRLLRTVKIRNAILTEPKVTGGEVIMERLGDDIAYETQRDGITVAVIERRYSMFAQNSGSIVIEPLIFEGRVTASQSISDSYIPERSVRVRSQPVSIEVKPIPEGFIGRHWLPARQVLLVDSWPDEFNNIHVGDPVTRSLTVRAAGLASSQLPEIGASAPDEIKQYPDQPLLENQFDADGLIATRREKVALIPSAAGTFTLPAIEFPWWNINTDQLEYARLPEKEITVLPAVDLPIPDARDLAAPANAANRQTGQAGTGLNNPGLWTWLSLVLGLGWLLTIAGWIWSRRNNVADDDDDANTLPTEKEAIAAVKTACAENNAADAKNALLQWAELQWRGNRASSLGDIAAKVEGELQTQVHELSQYLYSRSANAWNGDALWTAFTQRQLQQAKKPVKPRPELEPLYLS